MDGTESAPLQASRWARRSGELEARIRGLHERNAQLSANPGPPDFEQRKTMGSTPDQVARAEALARMASMRALEATRRTAIMRRHAASAHDRAAQLHELLAAAGTGDKNDQDDHRERAARHRRLAREDRAAADRIFRSHHIDPLAPGDS